MNEQSPKIPATVVINGGVTVAVTKTDGSTEEVKVRLVPIRQFEEYSKLVFDQPVFIEFLCAKQKGWADNLSDESIELVDQTGRALNDPRMDRHLERQRTVVGTMRPMVEKASALTNSLRTE